MTRAKVIISYAELSVPHLIEFSRNVVGKMTANNSTFSSPDVALSTLTTSTNTLELKFNAAQGGGKQQKLELEEADQDLRELLRIEGLYVERIAAGNELVIASSGFDYWKTSKTVNQPEFLVTNTGNSGEVILKRKTVSGARSWVWQQTTDPLQPNLWTQIAITTQASLKVGHLDLCTRVWFRSSYVTKDGQSDWSDPQEIIVT